jgi:hypothetical protein
LNFILTVLLILNDYGALKLYIRSPAANGPIRVFFTWYLDGQQQTISQFTQSLPAMASPVYNIIVVPISNFSTLSGASTSVNNLRINISGGSTTFYIDWIQLQSGIPAPASPTGIQSFSSGNLTPLFNTQVAINGSQIVQSFIQQPAGSYTVLSNRTNVSGSYSFGKIDLSTPIVTGLLPIINVAPSANDGDFVQTIGGVSTWTTLTNDTTFVGNGLVRRADPNSNNDTLYFGYSKADTASFAFDTYLNQNNFFLAMQKGRFEEYKGTNTVAANDLTLPSDGNTITITGNTQINAITTARWQAGSQVELIFTGTPTVKNNTAGGAGTATILLAGSTDFVAAANDVLSLVYDGTNWHESARKTASGATTQTLQQTFNTEVGGSILTKSDSIKTRHNTLRIVDTLAGTTMVSMAAGATSTTGIVLSVTSLGSNATALNVSSANGAKPAVFTQGSTPASNTQPAVTINQSIISTSSSADGLQINFTGAVVSGALGQPAGIDVYSTVGVAGLFRVDSTSTTAIAPVVQLYRSRSAGSTSDGVGESLDFLIASTSTSRLSNQLISKLTTVADATRTSQFIITGVNSAVTADLFTLSGSGALKLNKYTTSAFTGTAVNTIQSDASGNIIQGSLSAGIKASADLTAQTADVSSIATFTPSADGTFRIGAYVNVTAIVTNVITLKVTYTDENSNAVTQIIPLTLAATGAVGTTATVVGNNSATDIQIRCKSGSAITVLTTATGVGSETYDVGATIEQLR